MKKKISIAFLLAVLTTMMSFSVLAVETNSIEASVPMLISANPNVDLISITDEYATMPIDDEMMPVVDNTIRVQLDGEYVDFTDAAGNVVNPEILNDRTMVPMRKIFEIFKAEINWNGETRTVVATTTEKEITLTIDSDKAKIKDLANNEEKELTLDAAPVILNDRTMVPVRFIAESLEKEVGWDADERTVIIIDFDKLEKELEEKVPLLKEIFELELEAMESFKSTSDIEGEIVYKDKENKANNEKVEVEGTLELDMNKEKEIMMNIDLEFSGKGTIYDSLEEAGYKEMEITFLFADGSAFVMMKQNGEEMWANLGSEGDLSSLTTIQTTSTPKNYAEYMETIKTSLGELNSTSYILLKQMIQMLASVYSEENVQITGSSNNKTIKFEIDIIDFLGDMLGEAVGELEGTEMKMNLVEKIDKNKMDSVVIGLEMLIAEPSTEETFEINFELDMDFESINKDFDIEAPKIEL